MLLLAFLAPEKNDIKCREAHTFCNVLLGAFDFCMLNALGSYLRKGLFESVADSFSCLDIRTSVEVVDFWSDFLFIIMFTFMYTSVDVHLSR